MKISVALVWLVFGIVWQSGACQGASNSSNVSLSYQTDYAWLELTRSLPIKLTLFKVEGNVAQKVVGTIDIATNATDVKGGISDQSDTEILHSLDVHFDQHVTGSGVDLDKLKIHLEMTTFKNTSKWELSSLNLEFQGQRTSNCSSGCDLSSSNDIVVAPKPGYTSNPADKVCTKGYTICAPKALAWTCYDQTLQPRVLNETQYVFGISLLGMRLQPFYGVNDTVQRFGYRWDCDPIISIGLWQGLLVSLFFILITIWGFAYLNSALTPTRFDNPKGKSISVPQTE